MTDDSGHSGHHDHSGHSSPPSAAGHLEPYGARLTLRALRGDVDWEPVLTAFLEDVAAACVAAGASIIGHLKCVLHLPGGALACNLTSLRQGARCSRLAGEGPGEAPSDSGPACLAPGQEARLDLAVLVYGLSAATIDGIVRAAVSRAQGPLSPVQGSSLFTVAGGSVVR
jgi:hypothetical protein